ncbi:hypothetical protein ACFQE3_01010 [Deinococcus aquaticus]
MAHACARHGHEVLCTPGNPGIAAHARLIDSPQDTPTLARLAQQEGADLVIVGPEAYRPPAWSTSAPPWASPPSAPPAPPAASKGTRPGVRRSCSATASPPPRTTPSATSRPRWTTPRPSRPPSS